jgi:hypothetical protein
MECNRVTVFSLRSVSRLYTELSIRADHGPRVEAGYNTSTLALRVVRGDKKGTQPARGFSKINLTFSDLAIPLNLKFLW